MLTSRDLGRGIANFLFELLNDFGQSILRFFKLIECKILAVPSASTDPFVHAAIELGDNPRVIILSPAAVESSATLVDTQAVQNASRLVLSQCV
jgi:hypothetical protein